MNKLTRRLLLFFIFLSIFDMIITQIALTHLNVREGNPVGLWLYVNTGFTGMWFFKTLSVGISLSLLWFISKAISHRTVNTVLSINVLLVLVASLWNIVQVI